MSVECALSEARLAAFRHLKRGIEYNKTYEPIFTLSRLPHLLQTIPAIAHAQTKAVIPANLAVSHVVEYVTVGNVVANIFTSKTGNTFLNIGGAYPNQTFTGWIPPASPVSKSPTLAGIEGKRVKITGRIELYKGKPEIRINAASQLEVE